MKVVIEIPDEYCGDVLFNASLLEQEYANKGKIISANGIIQAAAEIGIISHISGNIQRQKEVLNRENG